MSTAIEDDMGAVHSQDHAEGPNQLINPARLASAVPGRMELRALKVYKGIRNRAADRPATLYKCA